MLNYALKRFLIAIPLLLGVTLLTFAVIYFTPGDPLAALKMNPQISPEIINYYQNKFNLNQPFISQYWGWLKNIFRLDLGYSFAYQTPVSKLVFSRAGNTLLLSVTAIIISWIFIIPIGVLSALHKNRITDRVLSFFSYLGISIPSFLLAIFVLYFIYNYRILPLGGMRSVGFEQLSTLGKIGDIIRHLIAPAFILAVGSIASLQRIIRANLLETLGSSYIFGARARGIPRRRIVYIHGLRNALNPMITIFGYQLSGLISGAALTEIIIGWPGLGQVMLEAVRKQDTYLVMASVLISGIFLISGNLIADILLAISDPRIRYSQN
jgi:peptide/nickel transport system permease protein